MNVLQILPELNVGGVETGTLDLARHLVSLGHKAVVVSNGGVLVKDLESFGAIHYSLPVHKKSIIGLIKTISKLVAIIKKEQIHVVHARSRVPAWIAYFACRKSSAVFITTCHGYYKRHVFSYCMGWAKRVIVPSHVIGRHMIEDFGVPRDRIRLIPRSVDLKRFTYVPPSERKPHSSFNVGIIGRLSSIKGHLYFIKAMAHVLRDIPQLKIWIVGDAPSSKASYKEELQVLVKRLGLWQNTEFLGTQKDIPEILKNTDLLVLATTTQEAFGRVIIEAQACGVPVVATSVGGVVDIIDDGKTGLLVPAADPENMAEAVTKIYKDKKLAQDLVENAYRKVKQKYNVELMVQSTIDVYKDALENSSVLIMKFSSLGDVILSTAAIKALRDKFKSKISFLVGDESKEVLFVCPYIDELLVCDFKNKDKSFLNFLKLAACLRKKNFDIVIDLQNNRRSHLLAFLTLALHRFGYDNKKLGFLLNHRIPDDKPTIDPVTHQFRILQMLDIELKPPSLQLWPTELDKRFIDEYLSSEWVSPHHKIVGINISASERWATKIWPLHHIVKLCEELGRRDMRVVVTGTEKDLPCAHQLINSVKNAKPINACGKTSVNQLACLIKRCSVYISVDSAPLHIAASVQTPFVAIFGSTDPRRHIPPAKHYVVLKKDLSCSPCYKSKCNRVECMESIKPEEVLEAIDKLMQ